MKPSWLPHLDSEATCVYILVIRSTPISNLTFPTSTETIDSVRFNLSESSVLASIGSDRTFTLYDIRTGKAERRVVMQVCHLRSLSPFFHSSATSSVPTTCPGHQPSRPHFSLPPRTTTSTPSTSARSRRQHKFTRRMSPPSQVAAGRPPARSSSRAVGTVLCASGRRARARVPRCTTRNACSGTFVLHAS